MHIGSFGVIIFLEDRYIRSIISGNVFNNHWADISKLMMLTGYFLLINVSGLFYTQEKLEI